MSLNDVIPQEYIVEKFYQYAGYPKYKKLTNVYERGCPVCRERKSWNKKRRLYYIVKEDHIFCHNSSSVGESSSGLPPSSGFAAEPAIFAGTLGVSNPSIVSSLSASLASFGVNIPVFTRVA